MTEFEIDELAQAIARELHERQMRHADPPSPEPTTLRERTEVADLDFDD